MSPQLLASPRAPQVGRPPLVPAHTSTRRSEGAPQRAEPSGRACVSFALSVPWRRCHRGPRPRPTILPALLATCGSASGVHRFRQRFSLVRKPAPFAQSTDRVFSKLIRNPRPIRELIMPKAVAEVMCVRTDNTDSGPRTILGDRRSRFSDARVIGKFTE